MPDWQAPGVLVIASGDEPAALAAARTRLGLRLLAVVSPADAPARLAVQASADLIWVELAAADEVAGTALIAPLTMAAKGQSRAVVIHVALPDIDRWDAEFGMVAGVQLIADATPLDRLVALGAAFTRSLGSVQEPGTAAMERIDRLQDEVARIARMLSQMTARDAGAVGGGAAYAPPPAGLAGRSSDYIGWAADPMLPSSPSMREPGRGFDGGGMPVDPYGAGRAVGSPLDARVRLIRQTIRLRRLRDQFLEPELFADPAWDMLLDLYAARLERKSVSVSSLCIAAAVPATTALRWIRSMTDAGLFIRESDPQDGRRVFMALADRATEALDRYFDAAGGLAPV